jgi:hypothetical protein
VGRLRPHSREVLFADNVAVMKDEEGVRRRLPKHIRQRKRCAVVRDGQVVQVESQSSTGQHMNCANSSAYGLRRCEHAHMLLSPAQQVLWASEIVQWRNTLVPGRRVSFHDVAAEWMDDDVILRLSWRVLNAL